MNIELDKNLKDRLIENGITFSKANIDNLDDILQLFTQRIKWFKEQEINQWQKYLEHHPRHEFEDVIVNGDYFILSKNGKIVAGFEISCDSKFWNDSSNDAYYIYKIVTTVGIKGFGNIIFDICENIAKLNDKKFLRLDCLSTNERLNKIYESHGFKLIKTGVKDYYHYALRELKLS